ncbi:hypothetical protein AB0K48_13480 [Nonomuraea sp. NPDC055795]
MRQYSGNRIGLAVVGTILLAAGAYAYLRGQNLLPGLAPRAKILPDAAAASIAAQPWMLWLLALTLLVLALLSLRWFLLSLGWGRRGARSGTGTAMLCVGLKDVEGLTGAAVRVVGDAERLNVHLACPASADVGTIVNKLDREIVGRIRREVCEDDRGAVVRLHVRR